MENGKKRERETREGLCKKEGSTNGIRCWANKIREEGSRTAEENEREK